MGKNEYEDEAKALLFREARRLKIFIKGGGYDELNQIKREALFISLLEDIDNDDAELLANNMIYKKVYQRTYQILCYGSISKPNRRIMKNG